jgi:hypothetical protein
MRLRFSYGDHLDLSNMFKQLVLTSLFLTTIVAAAQAQVLNLNDRDSANIIGNCTKWQDNSAACNFPSDEGAYTNLKAIELLDGGGTDVTFCSFKPANVTRSGTATIGADGKVLSTSASFSITVGNTIYIRHGCQDGVIGFPQYGQHPMMMNPFRGMDAVYRVGIKPHNNGMKSKVRLHNEK